MKPFQLTSLTVQQFRCFEDLSVDFHPDATVLVSQNGGGKTAILDALKYLLGCFISHFPKVAVPRVKEADGRDTWTAESTPEGTVLHLNPRSPFLRLIVEGKVREDVVVPDSTVRWDLHLKRDKSPEARKLMPVWLGCKELWKQADWYLDHDNDGDPVPIPIVAYYGSGRTVTGKKPDAYGRLHGEVNRYEAYRGALDGNLNYTKALEWFRFLEIKRDREMKEARDWDYRSLDFRTLDLAMKRLLPDLINLRTTSNPLKLQVDVVDEATGAVNSCLVDSQLGEGHKVVLALLLDLLRRILEANANVPGMTPETLLASPGVVMIDELELHLHPVWQQHILPDLMRTFPTLQFIVTIHSPLVISSIPKECVRVIHHGEILAVDTQTQGVECQDVLAAVFNTSSAPPDDPFVKRLAHYAQLEAKGMAKSPEGQRLYDELSQHFGENCPPLQRIEIHRRFMEKRGEN